ncbi:MAG: DNA repair protein RecN [Candidatus Marinimicrobia bacterium]|jgi:DNA repair protein RecN (Recombination protein N)|nr:DNA repair protein RecN [Candidatus Neomarinimicrobiota bacterium]MBT3574573.1 DNA repair protein RecN [Candidatus Neomarinimicrobiota bacterium]MBT3680459.1 DNA repair protein RecN [Candidatus Neomarinimicrobiota bacterium]MBT3951195.1 DNA repair protein RecN [Candidatus Neomarinimicrobiota bacterium]MBT4253036.1 DNA repair protein RecN [Candidatus Neomarinimicrobiota bacterium]
MLKSLHIENFAIVDEANVSFDRGLNVITGETGVGKSLIVDALSIALGERAFKDFIRDGYPNAIVEAVFEVKPSELKKLASQGFDVSTITVKREIRLEGKSKVWINGQSRTVQELKELGDLLVDLHGQHEHQYLLNEEHHVDFLDQFAESNELKQSVADKYHTLSGLIRELSEREKTASSRIEQFQLYAFQLQELNDINPQPNELDELEKERRVLENALTISEQASALFKEVDGSDGSALERLNTIIRQLEGLSTYTVTAATFLPEALAARVTLQGIADFASEYEKEVQADPQRLGEVESRIRVLGRLCQKYNRSYSELLAHWEEIRVRLEKQDDPDWSKEELTQSIKQHTQAYSKACHALSEHRRQEASILSTTVVEKLSHLGIPKARFEIEVSQEEQEQGLVEHNKKRFRADVTGMDKIVFWMQANPGEPLRPLARIASGGEISRIMLSIKSAMSGKDGIGTVIFDEIDTGISGRIARVVGDELKDLGRHHQLISITHLPQIASLADSHFRVEKHLINQRTVTRVKRLDENERINEIATLIGDGAPGETTLLAAKELLKQGD